MVSLTRLHGQLYGTCKCSNNRWPLVARRHMKGKRERENSDRTNNKKRASRFSFTLSHRGFCFYFRWCNLFFTHTHTWLAKVLILLFPSFSSPVSCEWDKISFGFAVATLSLSAFCKCASACVTVLSATEDIELATMNLATERFIPPTGQGSAVCEILLQIIYYPLPPCLWSCGPFGFPLPGRPGNLFSVSLSFPFLYFSSPRATGQQQPRSTVSTLTLDKV